MTDLHEQLYPDGEHQSLEDYYYIMYVAKCKRVEKLEQLVQLLLEGRKQ